MNWKSNNIDKKSCRKSILLHSINENLIFISNSHHYHFQKHGASNVPDKFFPLFERKKYWKRTKKSVQFLPILDTTWITSRVSQFIFENAQYFWCNQRADRKPTEKLSVSSQLFSIPVPNSTCTCIENSTIMIVEYS